MQKAVSRRCKPLSGSAAIHRLLLEADAIIELPDGRWAGFEVKLGSSPAAVDAAAASLLKLRDRVAGEAPLALGVITGTGYALSRRDGVLQIPIGSLTA